MPSHLRQRRNAANLRENAQIRRPRSTSARAWLGALGLCIALGCDSGSKREPVPNPPPAPADSKNAEAKAPLDDDALAERYLEVKAKFEADPTVAQGDQWPSLKKSLEEITNGAGAKPMRANAALLLGAMVETRGNAKAAVGYYEHAATLVFDDAGPFMALAVAHASSGNFTEAVKAQEDAARLDPDNLENWLALGELRMRAGDEDGSVKSYLAYEKRRKGLIDGLTLHDETGTYVVPPADRIGCAQALAAAADQGTAVALIYALRSDPEATVREAVVRVMGFHRLEVYLPVLQTQSTEETDAAVKEAIAWALGEIAREPVKIDPTERPRLPDDDPRASEGDVPKAEAAPVAPTKDSTLAPAGTKVGGTTPAEGKAPAEGTTPAEGKAPAEGKTPADSEPKGKSKAPAGPP